jgi:hypothetical protein
MTDGEFPPIWYPDPSAIVAVLCREPEWQSIAQLLLSGEVHWSTWTDVEVVAAIHARLTNRPGKLQVALEDWLKLKGELPFSTSHQVDHHDLTEATLLIRLAASSTARIHVRAGDALHLAILRHLPNALLVTKDARQTEAALAVELVPVWVGAADHPLAARCLRPIPVA